ncbi:MAG: T9SS type A sorting domain-containing protein [Saprospiraceae bacterium]|nr:T9SS type A sorting domain-containing protein [Saprospiraceae bacterium]
MTKQILSIFAIFAFMMSLQPLATAQCPTACTTVLPADVQAVVDTIHLDTFPNGQKGVPYDENLSFRLPHTTGPLVAFGAPPNIDINRFTISDVVGLPVGMSYQLDKALPATYDATAPATRDGCVRICGTPVQAGVFNVIIKASVNVAILGDVDQDIPLVFIVEPDSSAAFFSSSTFACDSATISFTNNIASNGDPNVTYSWDFGDGTTSTLENPPAVFYGDTGTYVVQYTAIVDTFPYFLETVVATATEADCNDDFIGIAGAPDMYISLEDGTGTEVLTNGSGLNILNDVGVGTYAPDTVWGGLFELDPTQTYTLYIRDYDATSTDEDCGIFNFSGNASSGSFSNGAASAQIDISHYVDTVTYTETITISTCNSVGEIDQVESSLNVYPNPTMGEVNVSFHLYGTEADAQVIISDMLGRTVHMEQVNAFGGNYKNTFDLSAYGKGVYILQVRVGNEMVNRKIVLK